MPTLLELQHFAVLDVTYAHNPTNLELVVTTNNPCHLTCYYTRKKPLRHLTTRIVRGLPSPSGAYWCFTAWITIDQQEAGDTLVHTFDMPFWQYCQTRWFSFRGTVAGVLSPSNTPIFTHHHSGILLYCNLGFEDYPISPGAPPCWAPDQAGAGTAAYIRDFVNVQEGLISCKIQAAGLHFIAKLYQEKWSLPYLNQTVKFDFNWFGPGRGSILIPGARIRFNYGGGWHNWNWTITAGAIPRLWKIQLHTGGRGSVWTELSWDNISITII